MLLVGDINDLLVLSLNAVLFNWKVLIEIFLGFYFGWSVVRRGLLVNLEKVELIKEYEVFLDNGF